MESRAAEAVLWQYFDDMQWGDKQQMFDVVVTHDRKVTMVLTMMMMMVVVLVVVVVVLVVAMLLIIAIGGNVADHCDDNDNDNDNHNYNVNDNDVDNTDDNSDNHLSFYDNTTTGSCWSARACAPCSCRMGGCCCGCRMWGCECKHRCLPRFVACVTV
jgi:hypothetical protein